MKERKKISEKKDNPPENRKLLGKKERRKERKW